MSLNSMLRGWKELAELKTSYLNGGDRSPLTNDDLGSFEKAANTRPPKELKPADLKAYLLAENFVRWSRLQRDYRWAGRRLKKKGYNPDDVRWLL